MSNNFDELLKALQAAEQDADETMAAAAAADEQPEDEATAAPTDAADDGADDEKIAAAAEDDDDGDEGEFGKSFEFTDENGVKHNAVDATEMVKSMLDRQEAHEDVLAKAMTTMTNVMQKQGEMIKSLTAEVKALSSQGRGRKSLLNVAEKPDAGLLKKSQDSDGMTQEEFFAKANAAFDAEKITGKDLNVISVCLRSSHPIDPELIKRVISA